MDTPPNAAPQVNRARSEGPRGGMLPRLPARAKRRFRVAGFHRVRADPRTNTRARERRENVFIRWISAGRTRREAAVPMIYYATGVENVIGAA